MKRCSYCGCEGEDDAGYCSGCGSPFPAEPTAGRDTPARISKRVREGECSYCGLKNAAQTEYCPGCGCRLTPTQVVIEEGQPANVSSASEAIHSENLWLAKDAWKCLGMFILFEFIIVEIWKGIGFVIPQCASRSETGAGHFVFALIQDTVQILNVLYFARTESLQSFLKAFGLTKGPSQYVWFAVAAALIIRTVGHLVITNHLSRGATTTSIRGFVHSTGIEQILYLAPALMAPFAEEMYMRGFFYRAFRGSYSVMASTLLILGFTMVTHIDQVHRSWIAAVDIGMLTIIQCFLRERTGNLWDCIICHFVFNATGAFLSLRVL